jgi:hypothetical protein
MEDLVKKYHKIIKEARALRASQLSSSTKKGENLRNAETNRIRRLLKIASDVNKNPHLFSNAYKRRLAHHIATTGHDTIFDYRNKGSTINVPKSVEGQISGIGNSEIISSRTALQPITDRERDTVKVIGAKETSKASRAAREKRGGLPLKYRKKS